MKITPPFELLNIIDSKLVLVNRYQSIATISLQKNIFIDFCLKIECGHIKESFEIARKAAQAEQLEFIYLFWVTGLLANTQAYGEFKVPCLLEYFPLALFENIQHILVEPTFPTPIKVKNFLFC